MKRISTLLLALLTSVALSAQAVLNEIYADPSPGNSEFFELYNTSPSGLPVSLDGFTIISYFEDGNKKGFNVIDLPNLSVAPHGYFVGSAAIPFNYQGNIGSTASDFNWNSPSLPANYGYLKRWVQTGNTAADGTNNYVEETLPVNFNDFFSRQVGNGASYNAMVFQNGVLVNCFIGGTGGVSKMPDYITKMPAFQLESVTTAGNPVYTINWGTFQASKPEFVVQDIGTDNGFIRKRDGMCGTWEKSSSTVQHTPKVTNGGSQTSVDGELTVESHIYPSTNPSDPSFVVYNITDGPADLFPVSLHVYADNGTVPGELDANDTFIESNTENSLADGSFTTYLPSKGQNVLLVAQTAAGCFDQVLFVRNAMAQMSPLPLQLKMFTGKMSQGNGVLEWVLSSNERCLSFEVLKSSDGREFTDVEKIPANGKAGEAYYTFSEPVESGRYYKLKIVNKDNSILYSPVVMIEQWSNHAGSKLSLLQNPVETSLSFRYQANEESKCTIRLYNSLGSQIKSVQVTVQKGFNNFSIVLDRQFTSGIYLLEVTGKEGKRTIRFVKH